jgi:hypothetical protein
MMAIRVIQWGTGPVGKTQLHAILDDPAYELVGALVYSPEKDGKDVGDILGRGKTGIVATTDKAKILGLEADLVLHAASKAYGFDSNTDDIVALLESGKTVITTTSYAHLGVIGRGTEQRIKRACETGRARFHGAGEHPGFVFERLAVTLTSVAYRVDSILLRQYVDSSHVPEKKMLVDLMGMGKRPEEINDDSPTFQAISTQSEQALAAAADVLGLKWDEITHEVKTATIGHDLVLPAATLPAGTVVGQVMSWSLRRAGAPVLTCEEYWTCTTEIDEWDIAPNGHTVRVDMKGAPNLSFELIFDNSPVKELGNIPGGYVVVALSAIRAAPEVLAAPPGVVIPKIFGAYQFPA